MPARTANVPFALRWCVLYLMQFPTGLHAALSTFSLHVRIDTNLSLSLSLCSFDFANDKYVLRDGISCLGIFILNLVTRFISPSWNFIRTVIKVQVECLKENCSQFFENCGRQLWISIPNVSNDSKRLKRSLACNGQAAFPPSRALPHPLPYSG